MEMSEAAQRRSKKANVGSPTRVKVPVSGAQNRSERANVGSPKQKAENVNVEGPKQKQKKQTSEA